MAIVEKQSLQSLLDLNPELGSDRSAYNNTAVQCAFFRYPDRSAAECRHPLAIQGVLPLFAAVGLGASLDVIQQIYNAYPQAVATESSNSHDTKKMPYWSKLITPLHAACRYGSTPEIVEFLVDTNPQALMPCRPQVPAASCVIESPLHLAVAHGAPLEIVRILIQRGKQQQESSDGLEKTPSRVSSLIGQPWTPLHYACGLRESSVELVRLLIEENPTWLRIKDSKRQTPLHLALERGQTLDVIQLLVKSCPDVLLMKDGNNRTPLHRTLESSRASSQQDVVKFLIDSQPDVLRERLSVSAMTALHIVCRKGAPLSLLRPVLEGYPAAVKTRDIEGRTPIHHACERWAQLKSLELLAAAWPESLQAQDCRGRTPLYCACESFAPLEIVQFFIEKQEKSIFVSENMGRTPLDISNNEDVRNILLGMEDICNGNLDNKRAKEIFLDWCIMKWWVCVWRLVEAKPSVVLLVDLDTSIMADILSRVGHSYKLQHMWDIIRRDPSIVDS